MAVPALRAGHPRNSRKVVLVVARPQGVEGLGKAGPGDALGRPMIPLAIRAWGSRGGSKTKTISFLAGRGVVKYGWT
jgi:hypothetical protein